VKQTVPVSARAMVARVRRALQRDRRDLHAAHGVMAKADLGAFYVVDLQKNRVIDAKVDLEALARQLDCIRPHERLQY